MIYQRKLTDPLNLKKFRKLWIKVISKLELKFLIDTVILGFPVDLKNTRVNPGKN